MLIRYDKDADAVAIWFKDMVAPCRTIDLTDDIFMDVDENGRLVGLEVLRASEKTNLLDFSSITIDFPEGQTMEVSLPKPLKI